MNNPIAFQVAGAFFLLLALADLLRFSFKTTIIIGSFTPPLMDESVGMFRLVGIRDVDFYIDGSD
jgi:hypothetical protein